MAAKSLRHAKNGLSPSKSEGVLQRARITEHFAHYWTKRHKNWNKEGRSLDGETDNASKQTLDWKELPRTEEKWIGSTQIENTATIFNARIITQKHWVRNQENRHWEEDDRWLHVFDRDQHHETAHWDQKTALRTHKPEGRTHNNLKDGSWIIETSA